MVVRLSKWLLCVGLIVGLGIQAATRKTAKLPFRVTKEEVVCVPPSIFEILVDKEGVSVCKADDVKLI